METEVKLTKLAKCAGCGAKVGAGVLAKLLSDIPVIQDDNLIVGFDKSDDAFVYRINDETAIVETVDFFPPTVDDPFDFGAIAAANALSDIYAMGAEPKTALNILMVPESMKDEDVRGILAGGYAKAAEAGVVIAGGHSIFDDTPKYGLSVTGFVHPDRIWKNAGARPGDYLFLTKRIGIGVILTASKAELVSPEVMRLATEQMKALNRAARDAARPYRIHAATDVTGFGLMGHLLEMMQGSGTSAELWFDRIPLLPGVEEPAELGFLPEGLYRNRSFAASEVEMEGLRLFEEDLLYDPQTSGGLLLAVDPADAAALESCLKTEAPDARCIGRVMASGNKRITVLATRA